MYSSSLLLITLLTCTAGRSQLRPHPRTRTETTGHLLSCPSFDRRNRGKWACPAGSGHHPRRPGRCARRDRWVQSLCVSFKKEQASDGRQRIRKDKVCTCSDKLCIELARARCWCLLACGRRARANSEHLSVNSFVGAEACAAKPNPCKARASNQIWKALRTEGCQMRSAWAVGEPMHAHSQ